MSVSADIRLWAALLLPSTRHPETGRMDLERAISLAEALDERLTARGYAAAGSAPVATAAPAAAAPECDPVGPTPPAVPRRGRPRKDPSGDHYAALPPAVQSAFDALWSDYALPKGKQEAARVYALLAPDAALVERIRAAAQADATGATDGGATRPDGTARKWLQGWLSARRWEDVPAAPTAPTATPEALQAAARNHRINALMNERRALVRLIDGLPNKALDAQLARLDGQLSALGVTVEAP